MNTSQWSIYVSGRLLGSFVFPSHWKPIQVRRYLIDVKQYPDTIVAKLEDSVDKVGAV